LGNFGNYIYRPSFGASGTSEYTNFDTGLANVDTEVSSGAYHRQLTTNAHGLTFTGPGVGGGLDADKVDGYHAASFLLSGGIATSASDSARLAGVLPAGYLLSGGTSLSASDSARLAGNLSSAFLLSGGTALSATDSSRLAGNLSTAFLTVGGSAGDSALLQGNLASAFLGASSNAVSANDSARLAGNLSTAFLGASSNAVSANDSVRLNGKLDTAFLAYDANAVSANDSSRLGGNLPSVYTRKDGTVAFTDTFSGTNAYFTGTLSATALSAANVYTTGNVGIGTGSPAHTLDVNGIMSGSTVLATTFSGTNVYATTITASTMSASDSFLLLGKTLAEVVASGGGAGDMMSDGTVAFTDMMSGTSAYFSSSLSASKFSGTSTSADDSTLLFGKTLAQVVASGGGGSGDVKSDGTVAFTDMLSGTSAYFSSSVSASKFSGTSTSADDSTLLFGKTLAEVVASGGGGAGDVKSDGTVAFTDMLSGTSAYFSSTISAAGFSGTAASASDSAMLQGNLASAFLGASSTALSANDSTLLFGKTLAQVVASGAACIVWSVPGTLVANATVSVCSQFYIPFDCTAVGVNLIVTTTPGTNADIIDIHYGAAGGIGTTIFSTKPQINAGAYTGGGAAAFSETALAAGNMLTMFIDQIGAAGNEGKFLTVELKVSVP
jgi:mannose/fructose-specific phosphotransferase system component IIA